jgi:isopentenyl-diphosphate delta-isomerase
VTARETHAVELVDGDGSAVGVSTVDEVHRAPGRLHRAFSVVLVDADGKVLLQQRAAVKTRFALRWANACCGHPRPGEAVTDAAAQRLREEVGVSDVRLAEVGVHVYKATDPDSGRVEHEYDHVLLGTFTPEHPLTPDPEEVAAVAWLPLDRLDEDLDRAPQMYAPWLCGVLGAWRGANTR